jgi:hypothetical protein
MLPKKSYIDNTGRLAIPIKLRNRLKLKPGDEVLLDCTDDNRLIVTTFRNPLDKARNLIAKYTDLSLVDELYVLRKEDAAKE